MTRLRNCAYLAFMITSTAATAQDVQTGPLSAGAMTGIETEVQIAGLVSDVGGAVLIGQDKAAPLCPEFCAPRRVTSPGQATVGEREVLAYRMAAATTGSKLHVDSRRSLWAQVEKFPSMALREPASTVVTQGAFRPALDPVLAEPPANPMK